MLTVTQDDMSTEVDDSGQLRMGKKLRGYTASILNSSLSTFLDDLHHLNVNVLNARSLVFSDSLEVMLLTLTGLQE
jgi:hypothetical protein